MSRKFLVSPVKISCYAGTKRHNLRRRGIRVPSANGTTWGPKSERRGIWWRVAGSTRFGAGGNRTGQYNRTSSQIVPFCAGVFRVENGVGIKQLIGLVSTRNTPAQKGTICHDVPLYCPVRFASVSGRVESATRHQIPRRSLFGPKVAAFADGSRIARRVKLCPFVPACFVSKTV